MSDALRIAAGLLAALVLVLATTASPPSAANAPNEARRIPLSAFPKERLIVETRDARRHFFESWRADTPSRRAQGLMFVADLRADQAMIFVYEGQQTVAMWMKNTLIPLDMLFVDSAGCVAAIREQAEPGSLETIQPPMPITLVVELAAGTVEELGLAVGDRVRRPAAGWLPDNAIRCAQSE